MDRRFYLLLLVIGGVFLTSGQTSSQDATVTASTNSTTTNGTQIALPAYLMDCRLTPSIIPKCSGNGVCGTDGKCRCWLGYTSYMKGDCFINVRMAPGADKFILVIRTFCGVAFGLLLLLTTWRIFIEFRNRYSGDLAPIKNLTKFALGMLFLYCFFNMLGCLDYWGLYGVISNAAYLIIYILPSPIAVFLFSAIILHWIEVYNTSTMTLKREQMISKINSNYTPAVSMEDILVKVTFLRRFRIFFAVIITLSLIFLIIFISLYFHAHNYTVWWVYFNFWMVYYLVCWVTLGLGFLIYGIRMYKLMPDGVRPKILAITILALFTVIFLILESVLIICLFYTNDFFATLVTMYVLRFFQVFCALNIYMPLWDWRSWFHKSAITSKDSKNTSGDKSNSVEIATFSGNHSAESV